MGELIHLNRCKCGNDDLEMFWAGCCVAICPKCMQKVEQDNVFDTVAEWNRNNQEDKADD